MEKIVVPKNTKLEIREENNLDHLNVEIEVEAGACLVYRAENKNNKIKRTAKIYADAKIIWFDINKNKSAESEIITRLVEPGARAETYGIFYGEQENQFSISHTTEHLASNTHSIMETKGVLDDKSRASIKSLIKIYSSITGCTGHERTDTLIVSRNAHIEAVPELEIGNNDVQCTHAVTTTRLSPEKLFYLEGRGLDEEEAKKMLIEAHLTGLHSLQDHQA